MTSSTTVYVCAYKDCGPYYKVDKIVKEATSLSSLIYTVRGFMEDDMDDIFVLTDKGVCKGAWFNDAEPEPDGEGGWGMPGPVYVLNRPSKANTKVMTLCSDRFSVPNQA
jgi:hypothetical protein